MMFEDLMERIKYDFISTLTKIEVNDNESAQLPEQRPVAFHYQHQELDGMGREEAESPALTGDNAPYRRNHPKVGRNDPCICGSGKKYKQCCGRLN